MLCGFTQCSTARRAKLKNWPTQWHSSEEAACHCVGQSTDCHVQAGDNVCKGGEGRAYPHCEGGGGNNDLHSRE